jgi:hypothetical protein
MIDARHPSRPRGVVYDLDAKAELRDVQAFDLESGEFVQLVRGPHGRFLYEALFEDLKYRPAGVGDDRPGPAARRRRPGGAGQGPAAGVAGAGGAGAEAGADHVHRGAEGVTNARPTPAP